MAGLLIGLLFVRWLSGESYGAFAVIYAAVMFLAGFHNVLLLEPMSVFGQASHAARITDYMFAQIKVHVVAAAILSGAMLLAGLVMSQFGIHRELASAVLGAALAIPFLFFCVAGAEDVLCDPSALGRRSRQLDLPAHVRDRAGSDAGRWLA
jgi:hypothetical protein